MKIKLWAACTDDWDGSFTVRLVNTKEEALHALGDKTEEEIDEAGFHDAGEIREIEIDFDPETGKLNKRFFINIG